MSEDDKDLTERIAGYLRHREPDARDVSVDQLARIPGGSSQEMFRLRARWGNDGGAVERDLILRREPPAGLVEAERDLEYCIYRALADTGLPVPFARYLEMDSRWLDRPFFIMDMSPGKPGHFYAPGDPYDGHGEAVARQFWQHLGTLAAMDHAALGLDHLRNGKLRERLWERELDHWEALFSENEREPEPVLRGALRYLRRHPPRQSAKPALVHGDYRSGNFLFTPDGKISAILDWEMAHVGDPLEDVAWAIDPSWPMTRHLPLEEGLAIWEAASGLKIEPEALDWWRLFSAFKASVLWLTAGRSFADGRNRQMVLAMSAVNAGHFHRSVILKHMEATGAMA